MKPSRVTVIVPALIMVILTAGCTSYLHGPPTVATQVSRPEMTYPMKPLPPETAFTSPIQTNPGNDTSINTPGDDVFFLAPVKDYQVGDVITVHGTTILSAGDPLLVEVVSSSFVPTRKMDPQLFTGVSGVVNVIQGSTGRPNSWSFSFPTHGFAPDTYIVTVSGITINVRDSTTFRLQARL
jgi:hypothetical protein